jgi:hypothetical protein
LTRRNWWPIDSPGAGHTELIPELTHVIQQYPQSPIKRGWATEGIAD